MQLPIEGFTAQTTNIFGTSQNLSSGMSSTRIGECQTKPTSGGTFELIGNDYSWWDYGYIRYCNLVIKTLKDNYDLFAKDITKYNHWLGEAYFCRAFEYYTMVKSYGGVPIIKTVDSYLNHSNIEDLYIPRNTEKEVVDFIAADLD
jgi:hypothetical protein